MSWLVVLVSIEVKLTKLQNFYTTSGGKHPTSKSGENALRMDLGRLRKRLDNGELSPAHAEAVRALPPKEPRGGWSKHRTRKNTKEEGKEEEGTRGEEQSPRKNKRTSVRTQSPRKKKRAIFQIKIIIIIIVLFCTHRSCARREAQINFFFCHMPVPASNPLIRHVRSLTLVLCVRLVTVV
jgi:hypothetical protein